MNCERCLGAKVIPIPSSMPAGFLRFGAGNYSGRNEMVCPRCDGTGKFEVPASPSPTEAEGAEGDMLEVTG